MDVADLDGVELFSELSRKKRKALARHGDVVRVESGAHLTDTGTLAREVFVIVEGTVDVALPDGAVKSLGPGAVVGEIGVLEGTTRTATVTATSPLRAIVFYGPELTALEESLPKLFAELRDIVAARSSDES
jgi:CRP-like cAMP-binding protein